jgi:serine protease Do
MNEAFLGVSSRKAEKGGATVLEVTKSSAAEKAGIKKGDIITKVNDSKIDNPETLFETIHDFKPNDKVKITFTRDGKEQTVTATLGKAEQMMPKNFNYNYNFKMPPMPPDMDGLHMGPWGPRPPKLGIKVQDAEDGKGVNILEVEDSSAAAKSGLRKGDIILQFDGTTVNSTNELVDQLEEARQKPTVKAKIQRGGVTQEIEIKIPRKLKTAEL